MLTLTLRPGESVDMSGERLRFVCVADTGYPVVKHAGLTAHLIPGRQVQFETPDGPVRIHARRVRGKTRFYFDAEQSVVITRCCGCSCCRTP